MYTGCVTLSMFLQGCLAAPFFYFIMFYKRISMIYIIGVLWLLYSIFYFFILNYTVKNESEFLSNACGQEAFNKYLKNYLINNAIIAIIAPVVHLWQVFFWVMKTVVFGTIDLISNVVKDLKGKK